MHRILFLYNRTIYLISGAREVALVQYLAGQTNNVTVVIFIYRIYLLYINGL